MGNGGSAQRWVEIRGAMLGKPFYLMGLVAAIAVWVGHQCDQRKQVWAGTHRPSNF